MAIIDDPKPLEQNLAAVTASAKQAAGDIADSALGAAFKGLEGAKKSVAETVQKAADALLGTAADLEAGPNAPAAEYLAQGSEKLEAGSEYLSRSSISDLIFDLGDLTRTRPVLVLGGAFVLGLLAGRFLKSQPAVVVRR